MREGRAKEARESSPLLNTGRKKPGFSGCAYLSPPVLFRRPDQTSDNDLCLTEKERLWGCQILGDSRRGTKGVVRGQQATQQELSKLAGEEDRDQPRASCAGKKA